MSGGTPDRVSYVLGYEDAIEDVAEFVRQYDTEVDTVELIEHLEELVGWRTEFAGTVEAELGQLLASRPEGDNPYEWEDRYLSAGDGDDGDDPTT